MKKTGIAVAVLLAAGFAVAGGAFFTGQQLEARLGDKLAEANEALERQFPGSDIQLALDSLERGVFTSQARYRIDLGGLAAEQPASELVLVERIEHGPFPLSRLARLQLMPVLTHSQAHLEETELTQPLFRMAQGEPLTLRTTLGYDQSATVAVEVASMQHADDELGFDFSGFSGEFEGSATVLRGEGSIARLALTSLGAQPGSVQLQDFRFDLDRVKGEAGIYLGEQSSRIERVQVELPDLAPLVLNGLGMRDRMSEEGELLKAEVQAQIESVTYADQLLGSLTIDASARDMDALALKDLADLVASYAETLDSDPEHEGLSSAQEDYLRNALLAFAASEPKLGLDRVSLHTANAESRLSVALGLHKPQGQGLTPDEAVRQMLSTLDIRLDVPKDSIRDLIGYKALFDPSLDPQEVSMEATLMASMAGNMAVGMGFATLDNDTLTSSLSYAGDDQVTFNGVTQPLEDFLAVLGMLMADVDTD